MNRDFTTVTELPGQEVSTEQIARLAHRYCWAGTYCAGRDVLEVGCGAGQGLGYLQSVSKSVRAGDISPALVECARAHYGSRLEVTEMDACAIELPDRSLDVILLFEAIYYLPSPERFLEQCRRLLRPKGRVLIVTANKDLYDFNPSPFSHRYFGVRELTALFHKYDFDCEFFGVSPVEETSMRQRLLRPVKLLAVKLNIIPKTMTGKKYLKRIVFGKLVPMPAEISGLEHSYFAPPRISAEIADVKHKVIYLAATRRD